ncbi:fumarylacetoacetate hydrolase family protein [Actinoplanes sp. RD1]|uniref:fumarylacetoacetate hydrolase family protein n=1 Tax=Actinoplanes sp. RD1 TaxID=3064538 RepID=UPI0027415424|nr:fumarylacetoacetate hydrolase family protein [Actinoplanes sp. RD1]
MRIARFHTGDGIIRVGLVGGDRVTEVTGAGGSVRALLPRLSSVRADGPSYDLADVVLAPPIDDPQKYLAIGMNYRAHAEEAARAGIPTPKHQLWFNKQVSCLAGPYDDIVRPAVSEQLDYEVELGVVIGRRCRNVRAGDAPSVVAGYLVANDVSVRDWLMARSPTFTLGKSFDTHGPIGPWLTTADEIPDPHRLGLRLTVNGDQRQQGRTDDMIHDIWAQIAELTTVMTLMPGDILATGTPSGIGAPTGTWLRPGDVVRAEIDGLGALENKVVAG